MKRKPGIVFIGSFIEKAKDGSVGGQMYACRSIINSSVSEQVEFLLIDSTTDSVPIPPVRKRIGKVFGRLGLLFKYLITRRVDKVLIFSSTGLSFIEKGLAGIISFLFFKKVIFAPRSGLIKAQAESSPVFRAYVKLVLMVSDKVICQGHEWRNFYNNIYGAKPGKYVVIQNWIDVNKYTANRPAYINKPGHAEVLIYIGWLEKYKGILDLIEAIALIKNNIGGLQVHIYGSGKAEQQAKDLCSKYGLQDICIFKGRADHDMKFAALASADMYVLPSHTEGFPNALLEAMASGLPSIACNVGSVSEIIVPNETGVLVEAQDVTALSQAIHSLYSDSALRARFSANGRQKVIDNNSLSIAEKKFIDLLT